MLLTVGICVERAVLEVGEIIRIWPTLLWKRQVTYYLPCKTCMATWSFFRSRFQIVIFNMKKYMSCCPCFACFGEIFSQYSYPKLNMALSWEKAICLCFIWFWKCNSKYSCWKTISVAVHIRWVNFLKLVFVRINV